LYGKVEICGVNTAKLKVLPNHEINALLERTKRGDKAAREALISGNLRLVLSVIQRFVNRGEMIDDLFQVGCVGLIKAIDNFDLSHMVKFSTYAVPMTIICRNHRRLSACLTSRCGWALTLHYTAVFLRFGVTLREFLAKYYGVSKGCHRSSSLGTDEGKAFFQKSFLCDCKYCS
jgi:hypothetical protein